VVSDVAVQIKKLLDEGVQVWYCYRWWKLLGGRTEEI
jgi:hypothetical protein